MRQVIESYALILIIALIAMIAISFTSLNLNIVQARRIYNDIRAEVQASNGAIVPSSNNVLTSDPKYMSNGFLTDHHYGFTYCITRQPITAVDANIASEDETFIYNSIYKIDFIYIYSIPIFGTQYYPISGYSA